VSSPTITGIQPSAAIEGGRIVIQGEGFAIDGPFVPEVRIGDARARIVYASSTELGVIVPIGLDGGRATVRVAGAPGETAFVEIAAPFATGLHQVDNPVFDRDGNLYVTYSGTRGQQVPVSIFRVRPNGTRETFSSGIVNPTSMAIDPHGRLYVSSRFEGTVYRVGDDGTAEPFASDLGVACGLAFADDGTLYVGDRSGTIFRVDQRGRATTFASLPASVAAFHLAMSPDGALHVTGPTLSSYDPLYRIDKDGAIEVLYASFGRPQGLAFDRHGTLFVAEALAGSSGVYRVRAGIAPELVLAGAGLVGVAFSPDGVTVVASNETAYRLPRTA
jgi:sugar lactone lactonase YvrE